MTRSSEKGKLAQFFLRFVRTPTTLVLRKPALLLLLIKLTELALPFLKRLRSRILNTSQAVPATCDFESGIIQGCLITAENLINLGRVEKRTLFQVPISQFLGGNKKLARALQEGTNKCAETSHNCLIARWIPANDRYEILQASLNMMSSIFGRNYVHQNALGDVAGHLFRSTWYCVTLMTPTKAEARLPEAQDQALLDTCTFTDMTRTPRETLRVCIVHESEIRAIADGKLVPPKWGFFNARHAERYRMLCDFSRNFQKQLVRTSADGRRLSKQNPFTSERVRKDEKPKSDAGLMKRVQSHPTLDIQGAAKLAKREALRPQASMPGPENLGVAASLADERERALGASEDNCFLRLHVPHFVGSSGAASLSQSSRSGDQHTGWISLEK